MTLHIIPTASVRSVEEVHDAARGGLLPRAGDKRRGVPVEVKEMILEAEQTNSVSMPSELFVAGGVEVDRTVGRVGRVKLRRMLADPCGAMSFFQGLGIDMFAACAHAGSRQWTVYVKIDSLQMPCCRYCVVCRLSGRVHRIS